MSMNLDRLTAPVEGTASYVRDILCAAYLKGIVISGFAMHFPPPYSNIHITMLFSALATHKEHC